MIGKLLGRTVPVSGCDFTLGDSVQIGAEPGNDVCILAPGVSGVHATIRREGALVWLEDAGTINGTFLNGVRIQREVIRHFDVISFGRFVDLIYVCREGTSDDQHATAAPSPPPAVVSVDGGATGAARPPRMVRVTLAGPSGRFSFEAGTYTIGRSPSAHVRLTDRKIARAHAILTVADSGVTIQDVQTRTGTRLNGKKISGVVALRGGDRLELGASAFAVEIVE